MLWQGSGVGTYVLREQKPRAAGFVQMLKRPTRPEVDLLYLAPALAPDDQSARTWHALLSSCTIRAGEHGVHRLYASLPEDGPELDIFRQFGFSLYTTETIYRLESATGKLPSGLRPQREVDIWPLWKLLLESTPRLVQIAEGLSDNDEQSRAASWLRLGWVSFLSTSTWVLEEQGEVVGGVQIQRGQSGHALRLITRNPAPEAASALLDGGLALLARSARRPVYVTVRVYQAGIRSLLENRGFHPLAEQVRAVKHTVVRVREPLPTMLTAMERNVAPAHSLARRRPEPVAAEETQAA